MPIDRNHAFAGAPAYRRSIGWPWRLFGNARRAAEAWRQFDRNARMASDCLLGCNAWCINGLGQPDRIRVDAKAVCRGILRVELFGDGRILLGPNVYVGDDTLLSAAASIRVGANVLIAHGVQIFDNDSHPVVPERRRRDFAAILGGGQREEIASGEIVIEDGAWIGFNAIILKGVTIGAGSVVAAGSVVTRDIPALVVAAGNPAHVVKRLADQPSAESASENP